MVFDYSWLVILALSIYTMSLPEVSQQAPFWITGTIVAVLFFCSALVHELAHALVSAKTGVRVTSIRPLIFGGVTQAESGPSNGRQEFLIALAGPTTSMAVGMMFFGVYTYSILTGQARLAGGMAAGLALINIFLLSLFNLIPGFPLDGGRLLRAFLWDRWGDMARATRVVSQIGSGFAVFLIIFGILLFFTARGLILGLWMFFTGLIMKQSAIGNYQGVMLKQALGGVPVRQIMTENVVTVDWLLSIQELVDNYIYRHHFTHFPVFNRDEFVGMVSIHGVKTLSKDLWVFKQVRDIMTPIEFVPCLLPMDDAGEALSRMAAGDSSPMPVVEDGRLMGLVTRNDILDFFKIKSDLEIA